MMFHYSYSVMPGWAADTQCQSVPCMAWERGERKGMMVQVSMQACTKMSNILQVVWDYKEGIID